MPEFEKSKGFKMKGPTFFKSALKKYGKAPMKDYDVKKGSHDHPHGKPSPAKHMVDGEWHTSTRSYGGRHSHKAPGPYEGSKITRTDYDNKGNVKSTRKHKKEGGTNVQNVKTKPKNVKSPVKIHKKGHEGREWGEKYGSPGMRGKTTGKHGDWSKSEYRHGAAPKGMKESGRGGSKKINPNKGNIQTPASGKKSPNKFLGKLKDKMGGGAKGAGLGMLLGGPLGALAGGLIGKRREKKKAEAEQASAAPAPMMKKGNKNYKEKDIKRGKYKGGKKEIYKTRDADSGKKRRIVAIHDKKGDVVKIKGGPKGTKYSLLKPKKEPRPKHNFKKRK